MKKIVIVSASLSLALMCLTACTRSNTNQTKNSSQEREHTSLVKENKRLKAKQQAKKESQSSNNSQDTVNTANTQANINSSDSTNLPPATDLHDFVNRYGVSPAAYKLQHGMNEKEALDSTPDNMKTSGELQTQRILDNQSN